MEYRRFCLYNIFGGVLWVTAFLVGGYAFGESELVKRNFQFVLVAIIFLSVLPAVIEILLARRRQRTPEPVAASPGPVVVHSEPVGAPSE